MWEFYLQSCEAGFRWGGLTVFQFQLARDIGAVPITRDYMVHEEDRLRAAANKKSPESGEELWTPPSPPDGNGKPVSRRTDSTL
jgi:hypothetical protein